MSTGETARSIFITGGASGIGRATAIFFAERGWFVGIADVNETGLIETLGMIESPRKSSHVLDVRDRKAWDAALDVFSAAAGGRIDVVFNNAGIAEGGPLIENSEAEIISLLDINVKGVIYGAQAAHAHLAKTAPGSILLNTASLAGIIGAPGLAAYSATKWAVRGLSESLDAEWAKDDIKVASICPGFIDTPMVDQTPDGSNQSMKQTLEEGGVPVEPVIEVPKVVWRAVQGDDVHYTVGKMAGRLRTMRRWLPGRVRKQMRENGVGADIET